MQVLSGLVEEAERSHQVTRLVRGQFVRELNAFFPNGWPDVLDAETWTSALTTSPAIPPGVRMAVDSPRRGG